jgi:hypothetical protein
MISIEDEVLGTSLAQYKFPWILDIATEEMMIAV